MRTGERTEAADAPAPPARRARRRGVATAVRSGFLILSGLGLVWLVLVFTTEEPRSRRTDVDAAETFAHLHHDQYPDEIRFYVPVEATVVRAASGAVVSSRLRYDLDVVRDSSVADFVRTYQVGRHGTAVASRTGAVYTDRYDDGRLRTVRVEYKGQKPYGGSDPLKDPRLSTSGATIVVTGER
ncbi:hypothetical protein ABZ208_25910 [Streptomyces sp. NPDC006208]|uniref:hypothetical protein n=1 Tax=Streptomyces sp. NPDC006208 TaxID=3156734 RepID=UPI0033B02947